MRRYQYKRRFKRHCIAYYKTYTIKDLKEIWDKYIIIMGIKE